MSLQRWLPLESNPDVLNKYAYGIGMPATWKFVDVYGLDPDLLAIVPQPVIAVMLLFPSTKKSKELPLGKVVTEKLENMFYTKQSETIGNACGTIALVHALANNVDLIQLDPSSVLGSFLSNTKDSSPEERANKLEHCKNMGAAHEESAQDGQTKAPDRNDKVDYHFVTFIHKGGSLYEMDGTRGGPILHVFIHKGGSLYEMDGTRGGPILHVFIHKGGSLYEMDGTRGGPILHVNTTSETFLTDAAGIVKRFMERDPDEINFTVMALVESFDYL